MSASLALAGAPAETNAAEWSVGELAGALRRTVEDAFGHVRLKGEISGFRGPHSSGHVYFCLKDEAAKIDAVMWKGTFARHRTRMSEGVEVVVTGKVTTYPNKSSYQIVVESLELAGAGALMALLEQRKRKLAAEGLFDAARKRPLPYLPEVIGVVTSPTGAVIRDILHRLEDRFPRHVLVWPVRVQGDTCGEEVAAAIRGFNALPEAGPIPRPDLLIVARGGGSVEDLLGFSEEAVVRAASESAIPLIAAVGHETDTTLIDLAADRRAPTPTAAAEMAVPVRAELVGQVADLARRQNGAVIRFAERCRSELHSAARALPKPDQLIGACRQRLDRAGARLDPSLSQAIRHSAARLAKPAGRLAIHSPAARLARARGKLDAVAGLPRQAVLRRLRDLRGRLGERGAALAAAQAAMLRTERVRIGERRTKVAHAGERLATALAHLLQRRREAAAKQCRLFDSVNYRAVLARGFAVVRDEAGQPLRAAAEVAPGQALAIEFADGRLRATAAGAAPDALRPARVRKPVGAPAQTSLFDA